MPFIPEMLPYYDRVDEFFPAYRNARRHRPRRARYRGRSSRCQSHTVIGCESPYIRPPSAARYTHSSPSVPVIDVGAEYRELGDDCEADGRPVR